MLIVLVLAGLVTFVVIISYNTLIGKKNQLRNAEGALDTQLKQRYDLIPNLVSIVKNYMDHESSLLQKIVALRSQAIEGPMDERKKQEINTKLTQNLRGLFVQAEQYPELRSSENFQELQQSLNRVEENIAAARRHFNAAVTELNNAIEMFPTNLLAGMLRLKKAEVFTIPDAEKKNVDLKNLFDSQ